MEFSNEIKDLAAALAKAQAEMGNAKKSSNNPFFKSKYADLAEVLDTCRDVLSKNGLSVVQPVGTMNDKTLEVHTMLMHSSGQWIKSTMNIPMKALDPQAAGSSITYARRYALAAMVGIAQADDDDDGEGSMGRKQEATPKEEQKPKSQSPAKNEVEPFVKSENNKWLLRSKNNGQWMDAWKVPKERLEEMLVDIDYSAGHGLIRNILKSRQNG